MGELRTSEVELLRLGRDLGGVREPEAKGHNSSHTNFVHAFLLKESLQGLNGNHRHAQLVFAGQGSGVECADGLHRSQPTLVVSQTW